MKFARSCQRQTYQHLQYEQGYVLVVSIFSVPNRVLLYLATTRKLETNV